MEQTDLFLISDYLAEDLTAAAKTAVEQRLKTEPEFAALFQAQKAQQTVLVAIRRAETKERLREQFQALPKPNPARTRRLWLGTALAIAASFLLLLWFAPWSSGPNLNQLALAEIEPYPLTVERGADAQLSSAQKAYQAGNYQEALPLFTAWLEQYPADDAARLYQAECWSLTGEYAAAVKALEQIPATSPYADAVQWKLALNLILAGATEQAKGVLQEIQQRSHYKNQEAGNLLKQVENAQ